MKNETIRKKIIQESKNQEFEPDNNFIIALREKINARIQELKLNENNIENNLFTRFRKIISKNFRRKEFLYFQLATFALLIISLSYFIVLPYFKNAININTDLITADLINILPEKISKEGVYPDTKFKILAQKEIPLQILKQQIKINPLTDFEIIKTNNKEYELSFNQTLETNTIYQITLNNENKEFNYSWAFQVKDYFRVINTIPVDKSIRVPVDISIKIKLSSSNLPENFSDFIEISPSIDGTFQKNDANIIFIPKDNLALNTIYTITVKKALFDTLSKETLKDDYVFSFETGENTIKQPVINIDKLSYEYTTDVSPTFKVQIYQNYSKNLFTEIYKLDSEGFDQITQNLIRVQNINWAENNKQIQFDRTKLKKLTTIKVNLDSFSDNINITLKDKLEEGVYLVDFGFDPNTPKISALLSITNISTYLDSTTNKILIWVNDIVNKKPISNAQIYVNNNLKGKTTENGLLEINNDLKDTNSFISIKVVQENNKTDFFIIDQSRLYTKFNPYFGKTNNKYWSYIYTDRSVYLAEDEIRVWGYVKSRNNQKINKIKLVVTKDYDTVIKRYNINLDEHGFFNKTISKLAFNGNYIIKLIDVNNYEIDSRSIQIKDYVKPTYVINFDVDKEAVTENDTINIKGNVKFFSGEPVEDLDLKVYAFDKEYLIKTDSNGDFSLNNIKANIEEYSYNKFLYVGYNNYSRISLINVVDNETNIGNSLASKEVKVLTKYSFEAKQTDKNKYTIKSYLLEPDKKNYKLHEDEQYKTQPANNLSVDVTLKELTYTKVEQPNAYDPIYGGKEKRYEYKPETKEIQLGNLKTNNKGEIYLSYNFKEESYYSLNITYKVNNDQFRTINTPILSLSMLKYNDQIPTDDYIYLEKSTTKEKYEINEKETFKVKATNEITSNSRYLFIVYQNGIKEYKLLNTPYIELTMQKDYIPNVYLKAVIYDGQKIRETQLAYFSFKSENKKGQISIKTNKNTYSPGEQVELELETKYQDKPIPMSINLSIVDEAYLKLFEDDINIQQSLYSNIQPGLKFSYISHLLENNIYESLGYGGLGGGAQKDKYTNNLRKNFKDTALFISGRSDKNGKYKTTFKLPDNITSWRITYQGISDSEIPEYFKDYTNITSTKPLFIQVAGSNKFLLNDKPILRIRSISDIDNKNLDINYKVISDSLSINQTFSAKTNQFVDLNIDNLKLGIHKILIQAQGPNNLEDALEYTISVYPTNLKEYNIKTTKLLDSTQLSLSDETTYVELEFDDLSRSYLYGNLINILNSKDIRSDNTLASDISAYLLNKYFNGNYQQSNIKLDNFYKTNPNNYDLYAYSILPYDTPDIEYNVNLLEVAKKTEYNLNLMSFGLKDYLERKLIESNSKYEIAIILYGLTLLNNNLLNEVQNLLSDESLSELGKLYLVLALIEYGDTKKALDISTQYLHLENLSKLEGAKEKLLLSRALSRLNKIKESLEVYEKASVDFNQTTKLSEILYIQSVLPKLSPVNGSFEYETKEVKESVNLEDKSNFTILLTQEEAKTIKFNNVKGNIGITIREVKTNNKIADNQNLIISKKYLVNNKETYSISTKDVVKVEITFNKNIKNQNSCVYLEEYIPSGLKLLPTEELINKESKQNELFLLGYSDSNYKICVNTLNKNSVYTYYLKPSSKGVFTIEPSLLYDDNGNIIGLSQNKEQIEIK